jgi:hypothetical protein
MPTVGFEILISGAIALLVSPAAKIQSVYVVPLHEAYCEFVTLNCFVNYPGS